MNLQTFIIPPRVSKDPRIAKTDQTRLSEGDDGFLYKMLSEKDQTKYRILSAREQEEELNRSREIKENMHTMTGKFKDGQYVKNNLSKSGLKFVPPQFGTSSHKNKVDKKAWENDIKNSTKPGGTMKSAKFQSTILELARNSQSAAVDDAEEEEVYHERDFTRHPTQDELRSRQSLHDSQIFDTINTMKTKYEQNLTVVEKLFNEKRAMEEKIQALEAMVFQNTNNGGNYDRSSSSAREHYQQPGNNFERFDHQMNATYANAPPYPAPNTAPIGNMSNSVGIAQSKLQRDRYTAHDLANSQNTYDYRQHSPQPPSSSEEPQIRYTKAKPSRYEPEVDRSAERARYTAQDLANEMNTYDYRKHSPQPHSTQRNEYHPGSQSTTQLPTRSQSAPRGGRSRERGAVAVSTDTGVNGRSVSATRRSTSGVSSQLQADADRYVQRRRAIEEKEKLERLEQERYEQSQKERLMKASLNGKQFTEMLRRQEEAQLTSQMKAEKKKQKEDEEAAKKEAERRQKLKEKEEFLSSSVRNSLSWKELKEQEEVKRRERVEQRKQELAAMTVPTTGLMAPSPSRRGSKEANANLPTNTFKAEDPAEVARRLAKQQKAIAEKEALRKEKEKEKAAIASATYTPMPKSAMEIRQEEYEAKAARRNQEKKEKEDREKAAQLKAERKQRDLLLSVKVPQGKPTKSVELRTEKIKLEVERQQEEERRHSLLMKKKQLAERETAAVVRGLINDREAERKGSTGSGHMELRNHDEEAAARAAAAREEYRAKLRENKQKLKESLKNRPSLLDRHDKKVASKTASLSALQKVAEVVHDNSRSKKKGGAAHEDDDLFDPKEKMLLGLDDF